MLKVKLQYTVNRTRTLSMCDSPCVYAIWKVNLVKFRSWAMHSRVYVLFWYIHKKIRLYPASICHLVTEIETMCYVIWSIQLLFSDIFIFGYYVHLSRLYDRENRRWKYEGDIHKNSIVHDKTRLSLPNSVFSMNFVWYYFVLRSVGLSRCPTVHT